MSRPSLVALLGAHSVITSAATPYGVGTEAVIQSERTIQFSRTEGATLSRRLLRSTGRRTLVAHSQLVNFFFTAALLFLRCSLLRELWKGAKRQPSWLPLTTRESCDSAAASRGEGELSYLLSPGQGLFDLSKLAAFAGLTSLSPPRFVSREGY